MFIDTCCSVFTMNEQPRRSRAVPLVENYAYHMVDRSGSSCRVIPRFVQDAVACIFFRWTISLYRPFSVEVERKTC